MKIHKMTLRHKHAFNEKSVSLNTNKIVLYSKENETGKTTLMRAILYTLGFAIPNTELIKFNDFEFSLEIINNRVVRKLQFLNNFHIEIAFFRAKVCFCPKK
jgi:predicted ATPase